MGIAYRVFTGTKYCRYCRNLRFSKSKAFLEEYILRSSASNGCRYCIFLVNTAEHFHYSLKDLIIELSRSKKWCILTFKSISPYHQLELYTPTGQPPSCPGNSQDTDCLDALLSGSPRRPDEYEFIRSCLRDCDANHPECKIADQELPTRLLDVGHADAKKKKKSGTYRNNLAFCGTQNNLHSP